MSEHLEGQFSEREQLERLRYFHTAFGGTNSRTPMEGSEVGRHVTAVWKAIQGDDPLPKPPHGYEYLRKRFPYGETDGREVPA